MPLESSNTPAEKWDAMLLEWGAPADRLPSVKAILASSGITQENLRELIRLSESRMGMGTRFRGFGGTDQDIQQIASDLEAEKTMFQSHFADHD